MINVIFKKFHFCCILKSMPIDKAVWEERQSICFDWQWGEKKEGNESANLAGHCPGRIETQSF